MKILPVKKKVGKTAFQNIKDLFNHNSNITKFGSSHYEDSVKRMFLKTRDNPCKSLQRNSIFRKALIKPLPLKIDSLQVPLTKISNFSNNYILV